MTIHKITHKECTQCAALKSLDEFQKLSRGRYGTAPHCKSCDKARKKQPEYLEREAIRARARRQRKVKPVYEITVTHKTCTKCGVTKIAQSFHRDKYKRDGLSNHCILCRSYERLQYFTDAVKRKKKGLYPYRMTIDIFNTLMVEQNGRCAICHNPPLPTKGLCVDHCHATGIVRGLLCQACNTGIGMLRDSTDNLLRAIEYLEKASTKTPSGNSSGM